MGTDSQALAVAFGLASAASWGSGDFSGGLATRRSNVYGVVILSQLVGAVFLVALAFLLEKSGTGTQNLWLGALAGIAGVIGLVALYRGLASGRMGVVAPLTAVVTAALPVLVSLITEGLPAPLQLVGFGIALVAVWLLSGAGGGASRRTRDVGLALVAGLGFGLFFILIGRVSHSAILWPLVAARVASIGFLFSFATLAGQWEAPARGRLPLIALAGVLDTGGNAFFALATQAGRLDIAAVLASLYPAATVLLAWLILKEHLLRRQWLGIVAALVALAFIAA